MGEAGFERPRRRQPTSGAEETESLARSSATSGRFSATQRADGLSVLTPNYQRHPHHPGQRSTAVMGGGVGGWFVV